MTGSGRLLPLLQRVALALTLLVCASLLSVGAAVPLTVADRVIGGFVPSAISATRYNGAAVFVAQSEYLVHSVALNGSALYPPVDVGALLPFGRLQGRLAADRTCTDGSRVWVQLAICPYPGNQMCSPPALWLLDVSTQSALQTLNLSAITFSPPLIPSSDLQLVDVDEDGVALLSGSGRAYALDSASGQQLSSFLLPGNGYAAIDVDALGQLWVLQALNGGSNALTLYGYSQQGQLLYTGKPDLSDIPQQLVAAMVVDAQSVAWISLVKSGAVYSWDTTTDKRGPSQRTALVSNYIGPILTSINSSCVCLAHLLEGALELLDTSDLLNNSTLLRSTAAALAVPHDVLWSYTQQALLVRVQSTGGSRMVAIDRTSGSLLYSFPIPDLGFRSNLAQDNSGRLFAQSYQGEGIGGKFAVSAVDPVRGVQSQFLLNVFNAGSGIAWNGNTQLLAVSQIGGISSGSVLYYTTEGVAQGSISVPRAQGSVGSMAYATINGQRVLLQQSGEVYALDSEGNVIAILATPGFTAQDLAVDDVAGAVYVLAFGTNFSQPGGAYQCRVAVFDATATLTEWLTPPTTWTRQQAMLGLGVDDVGDVYASSTTYSGLAVWTRSSARSGSHHRVQAAD